MDEILLHFKGSGGRRFWGLCSVHSLDYGNNNKSGITITATRSFILMEYKEFKVVKECNRDIAGFTNFTEVHSLWSVGASNFVIPERGRRWRVYDSGSLVFKKGFILPKHEV